MRSPFLGAGLGRLAGRGRSGASLVDQPIPEARMLGLRPLSLGAWRGVAGGAGSTRDATPPVCHPCHPRAANPRGSGEQLIEGPPHRSWARAACCALFLHQAARTGWLILKAFQMIAF
ncbi:hypothetical protein NN561_003932 [Cricetulus griseus]